MKKTAITALLTLAAAVYYPALPAAHAATIEDVLVQAAAQNPTVASVQELLSLKQDIETGDRQAIAGRVTQAILTRAGQGETAGMVNTLAAGGDVRSVIETAVRQQVQDRIGAQLGSYQEELALLTALLDGASLTPEASRQSTVLAGAPASYRQIFDMTATAYAPGPLDNGRWNDLTHLGGRIAKGVVAVDPRVIPLGTKLWIEGYGDAVAADTGSAIQGNRVDLAFSTRQEASAYGIKNVKVYVVE